jgi:hypothetical protein
MKLSELKVGEKFIFIGTSDKRVHMRVDSHNATLDIMCVDDSCVYCDLGDCVVERVSDIVTGQNRVLISELEPGQKFRYTRDGEVQSTEYARLVRVPQQLDVVNLRTFQLTLNVIDEFVEPSLEIAKVTLKIQ